MFPCVIEPVPGFYFIPLICPLFPNQDFNIYCKGEKGKWKKYHEIISNRMAWQFRGRTEIFSWGSSGKLHERGAFKTKPE